MRNFFSVFIISLLLTSCSSFGFDSPDFSFSRVFNMFGGKKSYNYKIPEGTKASKIVVYKEKRWLKLLDKDDVTIKSYKISLGKAPQGKKEFEGDNKTPEGKYFISNKNQNSQFYLSLLISYPNAADRAHAAKYGKSAGGEIMIHGLRNRSGLKGSLEHMFSDWTAGCIAVRNSQMDEIWKAVNVGTPIEIFP